ncbi:hypothetical protein [Microbispora sp. CSR-4]|uniref:hypothetical protein n=1 Tax=Microbispora sp. CSR-4 TaxID=2592813 RepID=UPI0021C8CE9C|nr:hypothetical protein [Microbispora sp. CSR-4]
MLGDQLGGVGHEVAVALMTRLLGGRRGGQEHVRPLDEPLVVVHRDTEHLADDMGRQAQRVLLDQLEAVTQAVEEFGGDRRDARTPPLGLARCEGALHDPSIARVLRRILVDQRVRVVVDADAAHEARQSGQAQIAAGRG